MKKSSYYMILIIVSMAIISLSCTSNIKSTIIGLNENIHHDDFEYSVTSFTKSPEIVSGQDTIKANGIFYLIHFKVINNALRVGHEWNNSIAYLIDENGNRYENSKEKQKIINNSVPFGFKEIYNTPHGSSEATLLVFELHANVREAYLMVNGGTLMGDVFDAGRFRRMKIKLF